MESNQIDTKSCPPPEFTDEAGGPIAGTTSPTDLGDPADATNARDFLRRIRAREPERYRQVLKRNPVNQNVTRDELSHELPYDATVGDEAGTLVVDRQQYRDWLTQQFR